MTLIEILVDYLKLTKDEKCDVIENECPWNYEIFENYAQGQYGWYSGCESNCFACWDSKPIEL